MASGILSRSAVWWFALLLGLGVAAGSFLGLAAASLPYPDPTPAMLEAQQRSILGWQAGLLAGLGLSGLAAAGLWRARR